MTRDISLSLTDMIAVYCLIIPIILVSIQYKLNIVKQTLISILRMSIQLFLVGIYLKYVFLWNNVWINFAWIAGMTIIAAWTTINQVNLPLKSMLWRNILALNLSFLSILLYFVLFVTNVNLSDASVLIPIAGMLLGNSLRSNVIVLNIFHKQLDENRQELELRQLLGADNREAILPYVQTAIKAGISPQLATMATLGLVSLPGMMTGQLLGGALPMTAIQYQIAIMIGIFAVQILSSALILKFSAPVIISNKNKRLKNQKSA